MAKVNPKVAKRLQERITNSDTLKRWAISRGMTPEDRYRLGATGNWHSVSEYYYKIMPLWCPLSSAWRLEASLPPVSSYVALARGGILETNYVPMRNVYTGIHQRLYVCDSEATRSILLRLQQQPVRALCWYFIKTHLVQTTFETGWLAMFEQVMSLKRKLDKPGWEEQLDGQCLNIARHVKVGDLVDSGQMPPDLLVIALRLLTVWLQDYFRQAHPAGGRVMFGKRNKSRRILVIYGHRQLVAHQKERLSEFYRSNLYRAPARMTHAIRHPR